MTDKQVWLAMAKMWDNPSLYEKDQAWVVLSEYSMFPYYGICHTLFNMDGVTNDQRERLKSQLPERCCGFGRMYCWPNDRLGATYRAEFCRKMARECPKPSK